METIIFQLLCCLYLYDSEMLGPVCIRKQRLYTVRRRGSTIHRIAGIPSSGACGNEPFGRYTVVRRRRKVCAKSVYRLPASKGLRSSSTMSDPLCDESRFLPPSVRHHAGHASLMADRAGRTRLLARHVRFYRTDGCTSRHPVTRLTNIFFSLNTTCNLLSHNSTSCCVSY